MDLQERLEQVVKEHNAVIDRLTEVRKEAERLDALRLKLLGQAELLKEQLTPEDEEKEETSPE